MATLTAGPYDYPLQEADETGRDYLIRCLVYHRATHQKWVEYIEAGGDMSDLSFRDVAGEDPLTAQRGIIADYDRLIAIAERLT